VLGHAGIVQSLIDDNCFVGRVKVSQCGPSGLLAPGEVTNPYLIFEVGSVNLIEQRQEIVELAPGRGNPLYTSLTASPDGPLAEFRSIHESVVLKTDLIVNLCTEELSDEDRHDASQDLDRRVAK